MCTFSSVGSPPRGIRKGSVMPALIAPEKRSYRNVGIWPIRLVGHIPIRELIRTWRRTYADLAAVIARDKPIHGDRLSRAGGLSTAHNPEACVGAGQPDYAARTRFSRPTRISSALVLIPSFLIMEYLWNAMVLGVTLRMSAASFMDLPATNNCITSR